MQNNRKRPRQNVSSEPQTGQTGFRPGPSGAAGYSGLMPVGGFVGNNQQRANLPTSGRGAATFNRSASSSYNNARSYPPQGQNYKRTDPNTNALSSSAQYQQVVRKNTVQNRNIPTGTGRAAPLPHISVSSNNHTSTCYPANQNGPYTGHSNASIYGGGVGMNRNNWGCDQQPPPYNNTNLMGNSSRVASYGRNNSFNQGTNSYMPRNETNAMYQQPPIQQTYPNQQTHPNQQQQYMPWSNQEMQPYNVYQQGNLGFIQNQAQEISDEWNNSFTEQTPAPVQTANKVNKNVAKKNTDQKTALMELKKSLHFLTVDVAEMKHWNKFKDSVQIIFELFGQLDSATTKGSMECKEFLIRDEKKNDVTCVFYEIDRQLPKITRGQWYRYV
ncbi:spermatogenesis-associated protein 22-like [Ruditapes philippinarum]|uniref:spermatogenesis-associated protein 22-like n=1 Tax=Ruditapes philippinarum TaxID=129788 RepID=UPI00295C3386|nr:spermatogenesis-associated protein 22-like [Ruditapes philippinarum]XP_060558839.1 spermatogenesis-associated protein 22-like [Ruditapes philippinarum]